MNALWANVFKPRHHAEDSVLTVLKRLPVFEGLSKRDLQLIEKILHEREFRSDETIFLQNDPGLGMYIIIQGDVDIVTEPEQHVLITLHDSEFFGELALSDDAPRTATAIAKSPCKLLCLFRSDLLDLMERNPKLGVRVLLRLARTLGERLRKTNEYICRLQDGDGSLSNLGR